MSDMYEGTSNGEPLDKPEVPEISDIPDIPEVAEVSATSDSTQVLEEPDIQIAVERLSEIENLDPKIWDALDTDSRLATLQSVENEMAEIQGRTPVAITADDTLGPSTFGGYNAATEAISVNTSHLNSDMAVDEFIDTIVHEGRHAYQDYAIKNPEFGEDTELVNSWAENQQNYLGAEEYGQELYENQPIEADAWGYATHIRNSLIANNWSKYDKAE